MINFKNSLKLDGILYLADYDNSTFNVSKLNASYVLSLKSGDTSGRVYRLPISEVVNDLIENQRLEIDENTLSLTSGDGSTILSSIELPIPEVDDQIIYEAGERVTFTSNNGNIVINSDDQHQTLAVDEANNIVYLSRGGGSFLLPGNDNNYLSNVTLAGTLITFEREGLPLLDIDLSNSFYINVEYDSYVARLDSNKTFRLLAGDNVSIDNVGIDSGLDLRINADNDFVLNALLDGNILKLERNNGDILSVDFSSIIPSSVVDTNNYLDTALLDGNVLRLGRNDGQFLNVDFSSIIPSNVNDTNNYVNNIALSGNDLVIGRVGLPSLSVSLSKFDDNFGFFIGSDESYFLVDQSNNVVNFTSGSNVSITRDDLDFTISSSNNYVSGGLLSGTDLVLSRDGLSDLIIDLSSLDTGGGVTTNNFVSGASLLGSELTLERSGLSDLTVDLSPLQGGSTDYIDSVSRSGNTLVFSGLGNAFNSSVNLGYSDIDINNWNLSFNSIYNGFLIQVNSGASTQITNNETINFVEGTDMSITRSGNTITFNSTLADTNNYLTSASLSGNDLLLLREGLPDLTVDLSSISNTNSTTDYISGASFNELDGLITFTGVGNAFSGTVDIDITGFDKGRWDQAYNNYIESASVSGTSTKTMTFTRRNGTTFSTSWVDIQGTSSGDSYNGWNLSVNGGGSTQILDNYTVDFVAGSGITLSRVDKTITISSSYTAPSIDYTDDVTFTESTGIIEFTGIGSSFSGSVDIGVTSAQKANWTEAYDNIIESGTVVGTSTKTMRFTRRDGSTFDVFWVDEQGSSGGGENLDQTTSIGGWTTNNITIGSSSVNNDYKLSTIGDVRFLSSSSRFELDSTGIQLSNSDYGLSIANSYARIDGFNSDQAIFQESQFGFYKGNTTLLLQDNLYSLTSNAIVLNHPSTLGGGTSTSVVGAINIDIKGFPAGLRMGYLPEDTGNSYNSVLVWQGDSSTDAGQVKWRSIDNLLEDAQEQTIQTRSVVVNSETTSDVFEVASAIESSTFQGKLKINASDIILLEDNGDFILPQYNSTNKTGTASYLAGIDNDGKVIKEDKSQFLTSYTETDPIFTGSPAFSISNGDISNWDTAYGWGDHSVVGYLTSFIEADPIFTASPAGSITTLNITNWSTAYSWGDHANEGYLTSYSESDPIFVASPAYNISTLNITNWNDAYSWGNHAAQGYLTSANLSSYATTSYVDTAVSDLVSSAPATLDTLNELASALGDDPNFATTVSNQIGLKLDASSPAGSITLSNISDWNESYGWGDHAAVGYLTSYVETDPIFSASPANNITLTQITEWDTAYNWGDHSTEGYLKSYTETDPIFTASAASGITLSNIDNWNDAYSWGDHSLAGYLTSYSETDPVFTASAAFGISTSDISNWSDAYSWGDHAGAGYLTSFTETDPIFNASPASGISTSDITNWNNANDASIASIAFSGSTTKTLTLTREDGTTIQSSFTDNEGDDFSFFIGSDESYFLVDDINNTVNFVSGENVSIARNDLELTINSTNNYLSSGTLSGSDLVLSRNGLSDITIDLSSLSTGSDTNDFLSNGSFDTSTGDLTLTIPNQSNVVVNIDGRYLASTNTVVERTIGGGSQYSSSQLTIDGESLVGTMALTGDIGSTITFARTNDPSGNGLIGRLDFVDEFNSITSSIGVSNFSSENFIRLKVDTATNEFRVYDDRLSLGMYSDSSGKLTTNSFDYVLGMSSTGEVLKLDPEDVGGGEAPVIEAVSVANEIALYNNSQNTVITTNGNSFPLEIDTVEFEDSAFSRSGNTITIQSDGRYRIDFHYNYQSTGGQRISLGIDLKINGVISKSYFDGYARQNTYETSAKGYWIGDLTANDQVTLEYRSVAGTGSSAFIGNFQHLSFTKLTTGGAVNVTTNNNNNITGNLSLDNTGIQIKDDNDNVVEEVLFSDLSDIKGLSLTGTASQTIPSNAWTKVTVWNSIEYDTLSGYNSSSKSYIVQEDGKYLIAAGVVQQSIADGKRYLLSIYKNGSLFKLLSRSVSGGSEIVGLSGSCTGDFQTGDEIAVYWYNADSTSHPLSTTTGYNHFSISKISSSFTITENINQNNIVGNLGINSGVVEITDDSGNVLDSADLNSFVDAAAVNNLTDTYSSVDKVQHIVSLTQAEYDSISVPDSETLYIIKA